MFLGCTLTLLFYKCLQLCRYLHPGYKLDPVSGVIKEVKKIFYDRLAGLTNRPGITGSNAKTPLPSSFANRNVPSILQKRKKTRQNYTTTSYSLTPPFPSILPQCIISPNLPRPILPRRRLTRILAPIPLARSHSRII